MLHLTRVTKCRREKILNLCRCSLLVEICIVSPVTRCSTAVAIRDTTCTKLIDQLVSQTTSKKRASGRCSYKGYSTIRALAKHGNAATGTELQFKISINERYRHVNEWFKQLNINGNNWYNESPELCILHVIVIALIKCIIPCIYLCVSKCCKCHTCSRQEEVTCQYRELQAKQMRNTDIKYLKCRRFSILEVE